MAVKHVEASGGSDNEGDVENEYVDISPGGRYARKKQTVQVQGMYGVSNSYLAMDLEEGTELVWNEIKISEEMSLLLRKDESREAVEKVLKIFKRVKHPNLMTYYGHWIDDKGPNNTLKIIYLTEHTATGTLRSFLKRSRSNKKRIGARVWRRWCRQIIRALDYLHSSEPSVTHGHLNCDTVYIQHDGNIKVGSIPPNIIKDFLQSLKAGKDFDEKACYKTPNSRDIIDFGNCLLEVFATGVEDLDMRNVAVIEFDNQKKKKKTPDLTVEERKLVLETSGRDKSQFLNNCFSGKTSASNLSFDKLFIEVPPLKVMAFYAVSRAKIPINMNYYKDSQSERGDKATVIVNDVIRTIERKKIDYDTLKKDIESNMYPTCGINVVSLYNDNDIPDNIEDFQGDDDEDRLIIRVKCELNPSHSDDKDKMLLFLELQLADQMIRQLSTDISLKDDTPELLADELIANRLINKGDRQMVIDSLEEMLSE